MPLIHPNNLRLAIELGEGNERLGPSSFFIVLHTALGSCASQRLNDGHVYRVPQ